MALRIIPAAERLSSGKVSLVILGPSKVGKTSLLHTLDPATTLAIDMEAGLQSVQTWGGASLRPETWQELNDIAVLVGGPNKALSNNQMLSQAHYDHAVSEYRDLDLSPYKLLFVDSITDMTRLAHIYADQNTPVSEKTGKADTRGAYGLLGQEVIKVLKHLQRTPHMSIALVGILDKTKDDYGRIEYTPQMDGAKAARELTGIVDQVISYSLFDVDGTGEDAKWSHNYDSGDTRGFVCQRANPYGLPAGDRSGNLDMIEPPDLGRLIEKINLPARKTFEWLQQSAAQQSKPESAAAAGKKGSK